MLILLLCASTLSVGAWWWAERPRFLEESKRIISRCDALFTGEYLSHSEVEAWRASLSRPPRFMGLYAGLSALFLHPSRKRLLEAVRCIRDPTDSVSRHNAEFIRSRLSEDQAWFDGVQSHPLTDAQRRAVIGNEDNNLVIAGAGTGKTSTIMGKVLYLANRRLCKPSEILVLAYTKKATLELKERFDRAGLEEVGIRTFHSLGRHIVAEAGERAPSVSRLACDERELGEFVRNKLADLLSEQVGHSLITAFFSDLLDEDDPAKDAQTGAEYIEIIRKRGLQPLRSITGKLLKSREEVAIANWLTLNGINWQYETSYEAEVATKRRRQYQPDFYLPDHKLYLEHFGIDEHGTPRLGIDKENYLKSMTWKRELHATNRTTLIETFSWMRNKGGITDHLSRLLEAQGVASRTLTEQEIEEIVCEANRPFSDFVNLLSQFLARFKVNNQSFEEIEARASSERDRVFLQIFQKLLSVYQGELERCREIDFHDMINSAAAAVAEGHFMPGYKYILVDEFQDISLSRLELLQELRTKVPHCRLFVVGDDWQSIFRFAGSDVTLITEFSDRVGQTWRTDLDTTFRFGQELVELTSHFVTKNPAQLRKRISSGIGALGRPPLCIVYSESQESDRQAVGLAVLDIAAHWDQEREASLLVLGRYNFSKPDWFGDLQRRECKKLGINAQFQTVHCAKGLEADFVLVLGLEVGLYGFPSGVADDPVLKMVTAEGDSFPEAEERRLFYVASTRTRNRTYLIASTNAPSPFVTELLHEKFADKVAVIGEPSKRFRCPVCKGRTIRRQEGRYGEFWACSNYPLCKGKLLQCYFCNDGVFCSQEEERKVFKCHKCGRPPLFCKACGGQLELKKKGKFGPFLGCSNYPTTGCKYTQPIEKLEPN